MHVRIAYALPGGKAGKRGNMLELILKIAVMFTLLKMNNLLTGGLPFWHKGLIFGLACIGLKVFVLLGILGEGGLTSGVLFMTVYGVLALGISCAYFWGVERVPGRFNTLFVVLGAILLVLFL